MISQKNKAKHFARLPAGGLDHTPGHGSIALSSNLARRLRTRNTLLQRQFPDMAFNPFSFDEGAPASTGADINPFAPDQPDEPVSNPFGDDLAASSPNPMDEPISGIGASFAPSSPAVSSTPSSAGSPPVVADAAVSGATTALAATAVTEDAPENVPAPEAGATFKQGYQEHTYPNGDRYEGLYDDDKRHGQGKFVTRGKATYVGVWCCHFFTCQPAERLSTIVFACHAPVSLASYCRPYKTPVFCVHCTRRQIEWFVCLRRYAQDFILTLSNLRIKPIHSFMYHSYNPR
jgi:hypothetical protein